MTINPFDISSFPKEEPDFFVKGSHLAWVKDVDFDSAVFSLKYVFTEHGEGNATFEIIGQYNADHGWVFEVASGASSAWVASNYSYDVYVTRLTDNETKCVYSGHVKVFESTDDRRTHAEIMVEKITLVIEGRADDTIDSYTIKGRSITRMSPTELRQWRDYYIHEVNKTGGSVISDVETPNPNKVRVRFV